jgi:hypothetical protein
MWSSPEDSHNVCDKKRVWLIAVTNTYVDDTISNGAEIKQQGSGYEIGTVLRLTLIRLSGKINQ